MGVHANRIIGGRYRLIKEIGRGSMGSVFLAEDLFRETSNVALKLLRPDRMTAFRKDRFRMECNFLSRLRHAHLARFYEFGDIPVRNGMEQEEIYLAVEHVEGPDLVTFFQRTGLSLDLVVRLTYQICLALQYIHTVGVVHLDVKPANILVREFPGGADIKMIDFGLATMRKALKKPIIRGSAPYMAPELIQGRKTDHRADLYSLGITMYEMIAGQPPFLSSDPASTLRHHLDKQPVPLKSKAPWIPVSLHEIVMNLLQKKPAARFSSANAVIQAMNECSNLDLVPETPGGYLYSSLSPEYIGHQKPLREAISILDRGTDSHCIAILGGAGAGKTRLVREVRRRAVANGRRVINCRFRPASPGLWELVRSLVEPSALLVEQESRGVHAESTWKALKEQIRLFQRLLDHSPDPEETLTIRGLNRRELIPLISEFCLNLAGLHPLIMFFEDLHYVDKYSMDLLEAVCHALARTDSSDHAAVVLTYRPGEIQEYVRRHLDSLRQSGRLTETHLPPFTTASIQECAETAFGKIKHVKDLSATLNEITGGNPFFVQEMIQEYIREQVIHSAAHGWEISLDRLKTVKPLPSIHSALIQKISLIPGEVRPVMEFICMVKADPDLSMISALTGFNEAGTREKIERLVQMDLVTWSNSATESVPVPIHDLVRTAVLSGMNPSRRKQRHGVVADYLDQQGVDEFEPAIARHYAAAGSRKAIPHAITAARGLLQQLAFDQAVDLVNLALSMHPDLDDWQTLLEIKVMTLSETAVLHESFSEINALQDAMKKAGREISLRLEFAKSLCHRETGNLDEMLRVVDGIEEKYDLSSDKAMYYNCIFHRLFAMAHRGEVQQADQLMAEEFEKVKRSGDRSVNAAKFIDNFTSISSDLHMSGMKHLASYKKYNDFSFPLFKKHGHIQGMIGCHSNNANIHLRYGRYTQALAILRKALRMARRNGLKLTELSLKNHIANVYSDMGRFKDSIDLQTSTLPFVDRNEMIVFKAKILWSIGGNYGKMGDTSTALRYLDESRQLFRKTGSLFHEFRVLIATGDVLAKGCRHEKALAQLQEARDLAQKFNNPHPVVFASIYITYTLTALGRFEEVHEIVNSLRPEVNRLGDPNLVIALKQSAGTAHSESGDLEAAVPLLKQVIDESRAHDLLHYTSVTLAQLADIRRHQTRYIKAFQLIQAAEQLLQRLFIFSRQDVYRVRMELMLAVNDLKSLGDALTEFRRHVTKSFPGSPFHRCTQWLITAKYHVSRYEFSKAARAAHRAIDQAEKTGLAEHVETAVLVKIQALIMAQKYTAAEGYLSKYQSTLQKSLKPISTGQYYLLKGILAREFHGDLETAGHCFQDGLAAIKDGQHLETAWRIHGELAANAVLNGDEAAAQQLFDMAAAMLRDIESRVPSEYLDSYRSGWERSVLEERILMFQQSKEQLTPPSGKIINMGDSPPALDTRLNDLLFHLLQTVNGFSNDPKAMYRQFVYLIVTAFKAERGILFLADDTGSLAVQIAVDSKNRSIKSASHFSMSVPGKVSKTRKPLFMEGNRSTTASMDEFDLRSVLCVPIETDRKLVGVLYIDSTALIRQFSETDMQLLVSVCRHLALHMENTWLWEEKLIREQSRRLAVEEELHQLQETTSGTRLFLGESPPFKRLVEQIRDVAPTEVSVLLLGETGTGKECAAYSIHEFSRRKTRPFVVIDCASIPESLLESELFGHEKGAFTSAVSRRIGKIEMADTGTVFLDEIGDVPINLQGKLLRIIEEKTFERVGGARRMNADVRFVAATNRDLQEMVLKGTFRSDLFYRLNVVTLTIPPLRDRDDDIRLLADYFLNRFSQEYQKPVQGFHPEALGLMLAHDWPGNIRELIHRIQRGVILSKTQWISLEDMDLQATTDSVRDTHRALLTAWNAIRITFDSLIGDVISGLKHEIWTDILPSVQAWILHTALDLTDGNKTTAADILGIDRRKIPRTLGKTSGTARSPDNFSAPADLKNNLRIIIQARLDKPSLDRTDLLSDLEDCLVQRAVEILGTNRAAIRKILNISRYLLDRKLQRLELI